MKIDIWVIVLDKTDQYHIFEEDAPFIKKIEEVYLFDWNRTIYDCEFAPSYDMKFLYTLVTFTEDTSASKREALEADYAYEANSNSNSNIYVHAPVVNRIIAEGDPLVVEQYGDSGVSFDDCDYDDQLDAICDHFVCNRPF